MRKRVLWGVVALGIAVAAPLASAGQRIVCWTDEHGRRACGDSVPPQYAKTERKVYNDKGRVVQTMERQKTAEEAAAERAEAEAAAAAREQQEREAAYDKFLVQTYSRVSDLEKARDERVALIDGQITVAEKSQADAQSGIDKLQARADNAAKKHDGKVPTKLERQLAAARKRWNDNQQAIDKLKADRSETMKKYAHDIERFRALKGLPPAEAGSEQAGEPKQ